MRSFFKAKKLLFAYVLLVGWIVLAIASHVFGTNFISFSITFLLLLILPGFSLARLLSFDLKGLSERLVLYVSIGFVYTFLLIAVGILGSLSINVLLAIYLAGSGGLFLCAFFRDLYRPNAKESSFDFRRVISAKSLPILIFMAVVTAYFFLVSVQGSNFKGDPLFHLSYVEKAFGGQALSIGNLGFIKNTIHIAYGFPVWHVFVAMLAKIQNIDPITSWYLLVSPLFLLVILAWYFIFRQVFNSRFLAIIGVFFFLSFNSDQNGYIFTRLVVPDTLNQLLLLPLLVGLSLKFVFQKTFNYKILVTSLLLALFLSLIHAVQYFYYLTIMIIFALSFGLSNFWRKDFWPDLKKILLIILIHISIIFLVLMALELKDNFVSQNLDLYLKIPRSIFYIFDWRFLLFVPMLSLFIRVSPRVSFVLASLSIVPILSIRPIQQFIVQLPNIGVVFLSRMPQNVSWFFLFWTLILGFVIFFIDRLYGSLKSKFIKITLNLSLFFGLGTFVWLEFVKNKPDYYLALIKPSASWIYANSFVVLMVLLAVAIFTITLEHFRPKVKDWFGHLEPKSYLTVSILLAISFLFVIPSWRGDLAVVDKVYDKGQLFASPKNVKANLVDIQTFGGEEGVNFISNQIPPKSVFLVFAGHATPFAALFDQFMVGYPQSSELEKYQTIYYPTVDFIQKIPLLREGDIDYILLVHTEYFSPTVFDEYPQYLEKIFDQNQTAVYRVKKASLSESL